MLYQCIFLIILSISLISILIKYSILLDNPKGERHKINYNKNVPLSGGTYLFLAILLNTFLSKPHNENFLILVFIMLLCYAYSNGNTFSEIKLVNLRSVYNRLASLLPGTHLARTSS